MSRDERLESMRQVAGTEAPAIQLYELKNFLFESGAVLSAAKLAYLDLNPTRSKVALIVTCFRGRLRSTLNFADSALRDYRIIVVALFGNGESSSPSNTPEFPNVIDYKDCVRAQHALVSRHLLLRTIDVIMGFSMGGQCAYYWSLMYPDIVKSSIIICSSARTSRHNYQFLEGPKAALQNAADFVIKDLAASKPSRGLRAFGKAYSAWLTSAEWFDLEMYKSLGYETLHDWDADVAGANYLGWDADDLLAKLSMWQHGDVTTLNSDDRSLEKTLSRIKAPVLLMPCSTDQYFRWEASARESRWIPSATLKVIPSVWGHLAGAGINQADTSWMAQAITEFVHRAT